MLFSILVSIAYLTCIYIYLYYCLHAFLLCFKDIYTRKQLIVCIEFRFHQLQRINCCCTFFHQISGIWSNCECNILSLCRSQVFTVSFLLPLSQDLWLDSLLIGKNCRKSFNNTYHISFSWQFPWNSINSYMWILRTMDLWKPNLILCTNLGTKKEFVTTFNIDRVESPQDRKAANPATTIHCRSSYWWINSQRPSR